MNARFASLPIFAVLAPLLAVAPFVATPALGQDPGSHPMLYAESERPGEYSSSASLPFDELPSAPLPAASAASAASAGGQAIAMERRPFTSFGVALKFGSTGLGFDVATPLSRFFNLRGGATFFSLNETLSGDGFTYTGSIKFQNAGASVDVFPFHDSFHISPGVTIYNNTNFDSAISVAGGQGFDLGSFSYTSDPNNPIHGTANITIGNRVAPRITFGSGNLIKQTGHFSIVTETGVEFISQPTVVLNVLGNGCTTFTVVAGVTIPTGCAPVSQTAVQQEQSNIQSAISFLRFYPISYIGIGYRFGSSH